MARTTQTSLVLNYLKEGNSITSAEAFELFGATRLSAIIYSLKKQGYNIEMVDIKSTNRFGESCHFGKYTLVSNSRE